MAWADYTLQVAVLKGLDSKLFPDAATQDLVSADVTGQAKELVEELADLYMENAARLAGGTEELLDLILAHDTLKSRLDKAVGLAYLYFVYKPKANTAGDGTLHANKSADVYNQDRASGRRTGDLVTVIQSLAARAPVALGLTTRTGSNVGSVLSGVFDRYGTN